MIDGIQVLFKEATEHRAVLVFRGPGLSAKVSDTDPKKEGQPIKKAVPKDDSPEAAFTANILNLFLQKAQEILKDLPLNKIGNGLVSHLPTPSSPEAPDR